MIKRISMRGPYISDMVEKRQGRLGGEVVALVVIGKGTRRAFHDFDITPAICWNAVNARTGISALRFGKVDPVSDARSRDGDKSSQLEPSRSLSAFLSAAMSNSNAIFVRSYLAVPG